MCANMTYVQPEATVLPLSQEMKDGTAVLSFLILAVRAHSSSSFSCLLLQATTPSPDSLGPVAEAASTGAADSSRQNYSHSSKSLSNLPPLLTGITEPLKPPARLPRPVRVRVKPMLSKINLVHTMQKDDGQGRRRCWKLRQAQPTRQEAVELGMPRD